ncbi:MAG: TlpA family protein disulfide reductase [Bacteroidales bacterium]|nr:TlpA family protein disulfide reductase [Bacteroidales bacterium]
MTNKALLFVISSLLYISSVSIVSAQNKYARDENGQWTVSIGDDLPSFEYITLTGDTLDSDFLRGQVCIIEFVASWCPFGKGQMKAMEDLIWRKYVVKKKRGYSNDLTILGFTEDFPQDTAQFRNLIKEKGISYPFAFDTDERVFTQFVTSKASVTRLIIVDRDGKIIALEDEFYRDTFRRTHHTIKKLLKHKK